ncbi:MAG: hypothetical protein CL570_02905 [Alphaproteobacteria bacterium]|nr:hypothetical protein [Alphaproteobacteria bacterium]
MKGVIITLYPLAGLVSLVAYFPQILNLMRAEEDCETVSLASWMIWLLSSGLTWWYSAVAVDDFAFFAVSSIHFVCISAVVALIAYNRYIRFRHLRVDIVADQVV